MSLVVDASVVVAALVDSSPVGAWAESVLLEGDLYAPALMPIETANLLRRLEAAGRIDKTTAGLAFGDLRQLIWQEVPFEPCADRIWALRPNVTAYDAWYVAAAELVGVSLATLAGRLIQAPGPRCGFVTFEARVE